MVKMPVGIPQVCGIASSSFVAPWSGSRLGYLKFVASWPESRLGYLEFCGSRGQGPGWDTSSFVASQSGTRLGYLKFVPFVVKIPVGIHRTFVVSWSRIWLGYLNKFCGFAVKIPVGIPLVCGFVVRIPAAPAGIPQVLRLRGQDPGLDTSSLWVRGQDPGRSRSRLGCLKFVGSW